MNDVRDFPADRYQSKLDEMERRALDAGGEPPYDGPMEARVAKVEAGMEYVQRDLGEIKADIREIKKDAKQDFRILFGAIIALGVSLAGLMAKGFRWL